ncbi:ABC transporter substrate-binding protein [Duncaniella freteri]|uniref:Iron ABC transporter substrate-binding protein n=9 Tax=Duncaniella TaxID=2518495 RepID=A0A4Z0V246_9BACT|nr:ABC transporter substrate-binding protein [Duncaniella freteri]TGG36824.1 iron ABC transporter substrate-binding protein [Duncaniella freteri]
MRSCSVILFLALIMVACGNRQENINEFVSDVYTPVYARGFSISGAEGKRSTLLTVSNPWQGADSVVVSLFISRDGEPVPDGFEGQVIYGDAARVITMSSTQIAMLDAIGESRKVVGVSGLGFISSPGIRSRRDSIGDVGYDSNFNYELIMSLDPDIVLLYGVNGASPVESKLRELDIPFIYIGDYLESSPLGKAEWMVALAEIVGRRDDGEKHFKEIAQSYNSLKELVSNAVEDVPKVMLNAPYGDTWFMPAEDNYSVQLIRDAGGEYIYGRNRSGISVPIDIEEAYMLCSDADIWLNPGSAGTLAELAVACPKFTDTDCFRSGHIFNNTRRSTSGGGNDYYESGVVNPDMVLRDLVKIFHPGLVHEEFVYHKQLN